MSAPVLTIFNNKGGVGKTSLVYHLAWMLTELGHSILVVDLDPQANLTAAFLQEEEVEDLLGDPKTRTARTIYECLEPLTQVGDIRSPDLVQIHPEATHQPALFSMAPELHLLPGDLSLSTFEDDLSAEWPRCFQSEGLFRPFRVITAFWQIMQAGAEQCGASIVLVDVGPSLGAINRSALIATDFVVVPLAADVFSRQGLRNLGPTLRRWRADWRKMLANWTEPAFALPRGGMQPLGYVIQQPSIRLKRPVQAYDKWARRMPAEYARSVLGRQVGGDVNWLEDPNQIAVVKHYRSLIPLAQDARKPIFHLAVADGARGSHAVAARDAGKDFEALAKEILRRIDETTAEQRSDGA